jgi:NodT family efflux transporter outer membrane factor (OMF) lipoprotein
MKRWLLVAATAVTVFSLISCKAGPDYRIRTPAELDIPAAWHEPVPPRGSVDFTAWWRGFADPELTSLIERATAGNRDLKTSRLRLRQARSRVAIADAARKQTVDANVRMNRSESDDASYSVGIDASWEAPIFGGLQREIEAARADSEAREAQVHATQVSIVAEVALRYVNLRGLQARLNVIRQQLESQETTLDLVNDRRAAGLVSDVDVARARTNVEQTRAQIAPLELSAAENVHRIAILLGDEPGALHSELDTPHPVPTPPSGIEIGIPADVLRQRPDVRSAERTFAAETARVGAAMADRYPRVTLSNSLTLAGTIGSAITGSLVRSMGASAFATILDGGRIREQIRIQTAEQELSLVQYEAAVHTALEEVENALTELHQHRQRRVALESAFRDSREAAELARDRYAAGLADFQVVLDAERTALSTDENLVANETDIATAVVQLFKALGGGWSTGEAAS